MTATTTRPSVLSNLRVASPCTASWDAMIGDDRKRFCRACELHVYDFSAMSENEILELVESTEGRLCGRLHRRADGTILTRDCPVGLRAARKRLCFAIARVAAAVAFLVGLLVFLRSAPAKGASAGGDSVSRIEPFRSINRWVGKPPEPPLMGEICITPKGGAPTGN